MPTKVIKAKAVKTSAKEKADKAEKRIQTVGRRKGATARVRLILDGSGDFVVNGKKNADYFRYIFTQNVTSEPLKLVGLEDSFDVSVKVAGGGIQAQAEAVRLGVARALIIHNIDFRPTLKKMGWLTRDPREKERKKPGLKRARRAPQWQKR
jgi:small subunit ribosomal protein S9